MTQFIDVDVRPMRRAGRQSYSTIMAALKRLEPGQGLRLYATVKPLPLFGVMADRGFAHEAIELGGGEWEIRFTPTGQAIPAEMQRTRPPCPATENKPADCSAPIVCLDNRELDPREPMDKILAAIEGLALGQTLSVRLSGEPVGLVQELAKRGHQWSGGFGADGTSYELTIKKCGNCPSRGNCPSCSGCQLREACLIDRGRT